MSGLNPSGLCQCGCGERTSLAPQSVTRRGYVKGQPVRFIAGHQNRSPGPDYVVDKQTDCWVWQRWTNNHGYGVTYNGGQRIYAHRFHYEQVCGLIPDGLTLDHLCSNPACVNPDHLEVVTQRENLRRGRRTKLTEADVVEIRTSTEGTAELAEHFGVAQETVQAARLGTTWADVEPPGVRIAKPKLTPGNIREIRGLLGARSQRDIAKRFRVDQSMISHIARGRSYADVV